jgi:hypothetical protein
MLSWNFLRRNRGAILGLIMLIILPVLTNILSSALQEIIGATLRWLLFIIVLLACLVGALYLFYRALGSSPQRLVLDDEMPPRRKGLIALVGVRSLQRDPVADAIEYHLRDVHGRPVLKTCWLVATEGPQGSIGVAQELKETYQERGVEVQIHRLRSAFDLQEAYNLVQHIVQDEFANFQPSDIIADITGGTKLMTAGMLLACVSQGLAMQYMTGGRPDIAPCPLEITFEPG